MGDAQQTAFRGPGVRITLHAGVSTLPEPTAYDGGASLADLKVGRALPATGATPVRALPQSAILRIRADSADVTLIGPVELFAGVDADERYDMAGQLADGATFLVKQFKGYAARIWLGGDWDRLRLVSPGLDGPVTVTLTAEETV